MQAARDKWLPSELPSGVTFDDNSYNDHNYTARYMSILGYG